jgi:hypothetical protein
MSAAQQAESENAESSDAVESAPPSVAEAPAQEEPAPAAEASVAQSALEPAEETASVETPSEQAAEPQAASPSESSDYSAQASSSDDAAMAEPETRESRAPVAAERQAPRGQTTVSSANRSAPPPAAQVLRPWWAPTSTDPFGIQYVGQVEGQRAVAILFSADIGNAGEIDKALKLIDESGQAVSGGWKVGNNPRLAVRSDLKQGRYTLAIDGQLASASGQNLRTPLRGPVYIQ